MQPRRVFLNFIFSSLAFGLSTQAFAADNHPKVLFKTNMGDIVLELYPDAAPKTVANFLSYVKSGHYNGTIFHRVIDNFMIQGGGYDSKLNEKPKKNPIPLEAGVAFAKGLKNDLGTISMARTDDPNSAAAQFFINVRDNESLNPRPEEKLQLTGYTPFGKVVEGMEVVDKIKALQTKSIEPMFQNLPVNTALVVSAKVIK